MTPDIEDLLGDGGTTKRRGRHPTPDSVDIKVDGVEPDVNFRDDEAPNMSPELVVKGVTTSWLYQVFRMDRKTCIKRLKNLQPIRMLRGDQPLYDVREAAAHLIPPKMDLAAVLKTMRVADLPVHLQEPYWSALLKKQRYEENCGDLWRTEKVLDVLGEVFTMMRDRMKLWVDTLSENTDVTDEQRRRLLEMVDALQKDMHQALIELPSRRRTENVGSEISDDDDAVE